MNTQQFNNSELENLFNQKFTENGDEAFSSTGNKLLDILFMSEYYSTHLNEVHIGDSHEEKLFAMFMRDPRFGLGRRDLGRILMSQANLTPEQVVLAGRYDDLFLMPHNISYIQYLFDQCKKGNELAKKWMPRYSSKHLVIARNFAQMLGMNKQQYGHFVKANTVENTMSRNNWENIQFDHVPSLASVKYAQAFAKHQPERYQQYLDDVRSGKKELHVSTTNVYDIYRNMDKIDADLFYSKLEKISGSWIPIIDVSGSMYDNVDSIGKALSVGKYLSDCSTYCPNQFVTFSSTPQLITQTGNSYQEIFNQMARADWGVSTDLGAVMNLLSRLKYFFPDYLIILSDMEFNSGSRQSKDAMMNNWKHRGINTKIVWWNFNNRNKTVPETDNYGNIFLSGYSPMLLKFLEVGFDGQAFLRNLLKEYAKSINF